MKQTNESVDEHQLRTRRLTRKLDLRILPLLAIIYFFSYLDRTNIANAKLAGLERDVHLTPEQYQWCLSIFFIGYIVLEIPSNIILRRWRASQWLSLIVLLWGLVAVSMAASYNFTTLFIGRFLLGAFESGLFPGIIYYTSLWYSKQQQAVRLGFFFSFSALAGAFGGLLAFGISQIHSSHVAGWQLIFIVEGVPTLLLAIVCWFCLPDSAEHARFLTDDERKLQIDRLDRDAGACQSHSFSWSQVISVFTDWKIYAFSLISISGTITMQGITLLMPTLILEMGHWTRVQSQVMTVPPYLMAFVAIFAVSRSSDRFTERSYHLVLTNLISMSGLLILMFVDRHHVYVLYAGVVLVTAGSYANVSIKVAWFNNNFASLTRRAVGSAVIVSSASLGGAVSAQIYRSNQKPSYFLGNSIALAFIVLQTILALVLRLVFARINRQRATMDKAQIERQIDRYGGIDLVGDRHPEFRYTL